MLRNIEAKEGSSKVNEADKQLLGILKALIGTEELLQS